jgi:mRNA interferase RelE/StbE
VAYRVEIRPAAGRAIRALERPVQEHVLAALTALQDAPRPVGSRRLQGLENLYRIKAGPGKRYRIIYRILDEASLVLVLKVGHRKDVYRQLG